MSRALFSGQIVSKSFCHPVTNWVDQQSIPSAILEGVLIFRGLLIQGTIHPRDHSSMEHNVHTREITGVSLSRGRYVRRFPCMMFFTFQLNVK